MIDTTNKEARYIITPEGKAEIDYFIVDNEGKAHRVCVWVGEYDPKARYMRPHNIFPVEECEEVK
jgi:hypothetical protein